MSKLNKTYYVFGPVQSRRLGKSLGLDIVPFKYCTFDCIYCQLGRTTNLTTDRKEYIPVPDLLEELKVKLESADRPDYITFSGSGEPTLNSSIGKIINEIKKITDVPVAVLTNSSFLWDNEVRKEIMNADLVVPSLDAGCEETFRIINKPVTNLKFDMVVQGLIDFCSEYNGKLWLEVFLISGINDTEEEVLKIKKYIDVIKHDLVQVNTVIRPPAEPSALRVSKEKLEYLTKLLGTNTQVIADYSRMDDYIKDMINQDDILNLLYRRPCTLTDISNGLSRHPNEVLKKLNVLLENNLIKTEPRNNENYFMPVGR